MYCRHCSPHLGLLLCMHVVVVIDSLKIFALGNAEHQEDSVDQQIFRWVGESQQTSMVKNVNLPPDLITRSHVAWSMILL